MFTHLEGTIPANIEITLQNREIIHSETGSHVIMPKDTISTAEGFLKQIGIDVIEQVDLEITDGVPVYKINKAPKKAKCHRQACLLAPPPTSLNRPPRECFGKGMTVQQSKASALMEAVERYSGQRFPHHNIIEASYEVVKSYAIHPSEFVVPGLSPKCRYCGYKDSSCFQDLEKVSQEWSWGYSLIRKSPVLVPSAMVFYPYISKNKISFVFNDTGGLSAGNTIEEAILQGIAEVIERDALYYSFNLGNITCMQMIDFQTTKNKYFRQFLEQVLPPESLYVYYIRNANLDINIPSFSAFICYETEDGLRYFGGSGTSLDVDTALLRALTEIEQQKVRQGASKKFERSVLVKHHCLKRSEYTKLEELPSQSTINIRSDIELFLDIISKVNTDVIVVNLTHPELAIPVVRILIPRLISYSGSEIKESYLLDAMRNFGGQT